MKTKSIIGINIALVTAGMWLCGCSDSFLEDKQDYSKTTAEIYNDYTGALARVDNLYYLMLPESNTSVSYKYPSSGSSDIHSQSTEEYSGLSSYVDVDVVITSSSNLGDYFYNELKANSSPYGFIRNCNNVIEGVLGGTLSDSEKQELLGQAYFFRAWCYYRLVQSYGGVPIIDYVQSLTSTLDVPRSTTKECIDFICNDLSIAAKYLPMSWPSTSYGRVTSGTALALQGRARLLYASPLFNRTDDVSRWELAYQSNKNALDTLALGGFGLAYVNDPGVNASGWAKMFSDYQSEEAVFVTLYNNIKDGGSTNLYKNNGWENSIRPVNTGTTSSKYPSATMVDLFPMADGKKPGESEYAYNTHLFMLNRDPRFYRTFAFTGVRWAFSGDPTSGTTYPYQGKDYELWNYAWYDTAEKKQASDQSGYGADGLNTSYRGIYLRKRSDDFDINNSPLYDFDITAANGPFRYSAAPYMEIRYAEVLLNFAEAACGAGHYAEAVEALQLIRKRVGYTDSNNYGLPTGLSGDRAALFAAILYERQIELAYEGKRFDDMRRWMLWDGGQNQVSLKSTWAVTGFGGNTCTYLGVSPFNGQRRDNLELRVADSVNEGLATAAQASDPLSGERPAAWNLLTSTQPSDALEDFYQNKLMRKTRKGDELTKTVSFQPQYYFIGFTNSAQKADVYLEQTIGWQDYYNSGAAGTFDPLAE